MLRAIYEREMAKKKTSAAAADAEGPKSDAVEKPGPDVSLAEDHAEDDPAHEGGESEAEAAEDAIMVDAGDSQVPASPKDVN